MVFHQCDETLADHTGTADDTNFVLLHIDLPPVIVEKRQPLMNSVAKRRIFDYNITVYVLWFWENVFPTRTIVLLV